jgi:hypothetical protein
MAGGGWALAAACPPSVPHLEPFGKGPPDGTFPDGGLPRSQGIVAAVPISTTRGDGNTDVVPQGTGSTRLALPPLWQRKTAPEGFRS